MSEKWEQTAIKEVLLSNFKEQKSPKTLSEKVKEVFKLGDTSKPSR